jgi:hypothetical protein
MPSWCPVLWALFECLNDIELLSKLGSFAPFEAGGWLSKFYTHLTFSRVIPSAD